MKKLKINAFVAVAVCIMLCFCSCTGFFSNPVSLMTPPKSSGALVEIEQILSEKHSEYSLAYPSQGEFRNAVLFRDIDENGTDDAIIFYQTTENKTITVYMSIFTCVSDEWTLKCDQKLSGYGVDRIEFADLCGDSRDEILVGSKLYNANEQELNCYKFDGKKLTLLSTERYTDYRVCDLGASEKSQVLLLNIVSESTNKSEESDTESMNVQKSVSAKLVSYSYDDDGTAVTLGIANMDQSIVSFSNIIVSPIDDNQNGVFIDAIVDNNAMITEILYYDETIKTTFYNVRSGVTEATYRDSLIVSRDIDSDGKVEIPRTYLCKGYETVESSEEKAYFTEWYSVDKHAISGRDTCGFINSADNYFIETSASWLGKITVKRELDDRERVFCEWDFTNKTFGDEIFRIKVFLKSNYESNSQGYVKIKTDTEYVYAAKVNSKTESENKVTIDDIKHNFKLF